MTNILITGHKGFVGNALLEKLQSSENFIVGIDNDYNPYKKLKYSPNISINGDIRDFDLLKEIIIKHEIQEIYHLASWPITKICANDPLTTFDVNVKGFANLLEVCRLYGENVKNIIISTSDKAFGKSKVPYNENSSLEPLFVYDTSKSCQQLMALCYFNNYNLPIKIVACSNIYGPGDYNMSRVIPMCLTKIAQDLPMRLWKDSENHVREFVYIDDAVGAFIIVAKKGKIGDLYCCGGTEHLKIKDLMKKICLINGKNFEESIKVYERPTGLMEIEEQYIDSTKLKSLGWNPKTSLEEGIKKSMDFYKKLSNSMSSKNKNHE